MTNADHRVMRFAFYSCRNISGPHDKVEERRVYSGHAPASSFLELEDNENVREYLVDAPGKKKRSPTLVHQAMRRTLDEYPERFSVLNGGITIVAEHASLDDKGGYLELTKASILNGSQTQGELRRYFERSQDKGDEFIEPSVTFEIIVTSDPDLIAEISIARNFQNDVKAISIAGRRGQLNELEVALRMAFPDAKLRKSETEIENVVDTERVVQVLWALVPDELLSKLLGETTPNRTFAYSQKTRCLKLFQRVEESKDEGVSREIYDFFLKNVGAAWKLYLHWKAHPNFYGTRIRAIDRDDKGNILNVPDGIVIPIIAAYSAFSRKTKDGWLLDPPQSFSEARLIDSATQAYQEIAGHNPGTMGKSKGCYTQLKLITSLYAELSQN